ncbi:hypothetical protein GCM10010885_22330 [Alicyclobacillus cellulosilyticus]|uniref:DUF1641 domain-containing protein n=1 Tax=Alicyclobacillus cellulosilyticus TaxID=1003997 RepID=A0A917KI46_9BACL|nr:DUF1641 domain-containing protein [Alicyclobacillus cellulosilyticus]GGJ12472.1 hypothetical protein GCM10010885_22330 [Alicyclobacillus cellulosilyticus]
MANVATPARNAQVDLEDLLLQPETQEALTTVLEQLPKLAKMLTVLGKLCDVAEAALTDGEMLQAATDLLKEKTQPIQDKVKEGMAVIQEARARAAQDHTKVGLFTLLRLLKDPTVQKNLRFLHALLSVLAERSEQAPAQR